MDTKALAVTLTTDQIKEIVAHHLLHHHVDAHTELMCVTTGEEYDDHLAAISSKDIMLEQCMTILENDFTSDIVGKMALLSNNYLRK